MTLKNPSANFFDSDFDSRDESSIYSDTSDVLNVAFIESPTVPFPCIFDDSSVIDIPQLPQYNDGEKVLEKARSLSMSGNKDTVEVFNQLNNLCTTNEFPTTGSTDENLIWSETNPRPKGINELNWISSARRNSKPIIDDLYSEIEKIHLSENSGTTDLSQMSDDKPACVFTSTCLDNSITQSEKYECIKLERSATTTDDESEKFEPAIRKSYSTSAYVYHELSTIPEVDSMCMDESIQSFTSSDKYTGFCTTISSVPVPLKANVSVDIFSNSKGLSNFLPCMFEFAQNKDIEKLLQEPGILEESDLTLVKTYFDLASHVWENSVDKNRCYSDYKIKQFDDEESPSLMSFLQHEINCMRDCPDESFSS